MLIGNGLTINKNSVSYTGATFNGFSWNGDDEQIIVGDTKSSIPEGYGDKAFRMPRKTGSLVGRSYFEFTSSNPILISGKNITGDTSFEFASEGEASKLVNMSGDTSLSFSQSGSLSKVVNLTGDTSFAFDQTGILAVPAVNLTGDASFSFAQNGSMSVVKYLNGSSSFSFSSNADMKVIKNLNGTTADTSVLSPETIWNYSNRTLTSSSGSGGLTDEQSTQLSNIEALASLIPATL